MHERGYKPSALERFRGGKKEAIATFLALALSAETAFASEEADQELDNESSEVTRIEETTIDSLGNHWSVSGAQIIREGVQFEATGPEITARTTTARYDVLFDPDPNEEGDELNIRYEHCNADFTDLDTPDENIGRITLDGVVTTGARLFEVTRLPLDNQDIPDRHTLQERVQMHIDGMIAPYAALAGVQAAGNGEGPQADWLREQLTNDYERLLDLAPGLESDLAEHLEQVGVDISET